MELQDALLCSQLSISVPYSARNFLTYFFKVHFVIHSNLYLNLKSGLS
jgi:hypothetical protein